MEPRPPKTPRPASLSRPPASMTPPPVPNAERLADRPTWLDQPSARSVSHDPRGYDDRTAGETAPANPFAPRSDPLSQPGAAGQPGPYGQYGQPGVNGAARSGWFDAEATGALLEPGARSPLTPVVSPRGERRGRFLGPILAALLLIALIGGGAFAFDKARDGDDNRSNAEATRAALALASASPEDAETSTPEATATAESAAENTPAPTATTEPAPTENAAAPAEASPAEEEPAGAEPTEQSSGTRRAADYLPTLGDLPEGFQRSVDGRLTKAEVAAQLPGDGEATLEEWTWRENASLDFTNADAAANETFYLIVSVHRFGRSAGASAGLNGLADVLDSITEPDHEEVDVEQIGDEARAFAAEGDNANLYVLYVRSRNIVYRIGGSSLNGDASADVIALAEILIDR